MIDIRAELEEVRNSFISIYDLVSVSKDATGEDVSLVCQWLLKRIKEKYTENNILNICTISQFHEIEYAYSNAEEDFSFLSRKLSKLIERCCLPIDADDIPFEDNDWVDNAYFQYGFKKSEIEDIFPELKKYIYKVAGIISNDISVSSNNTTYLQEYEEPLLPPTIQVNQQSSVCDFSGKETALMLIAGLAVALEKTNERFKRGGKMNKSAVVGAAEHAINTHGKGVNVTSRALRDWLNLALNMHASKLED